MLAVSGTGIALVTIFVDPTGQERHSIVFRIAAVTLALLALVDAFARDGSTDPAIGAEGELPSAIEPGEVTDALV